MRIEILQYLKDNDTGHLISLNGKLKELLGNQPVHNLNSLLHDMHTDGVAIINGNYGWFGGAQAGVPHTLDNIPIVGRILPKGKTELKDNELKDAQILLAKSQLLNTPSSSNIPDLTDNQKAAKIYIDGMDKARLDQKRREDADNAILELTKNQSFEKHAPKPKWRTIEFYIEETVKHAVKGIWILLIAAFVWLSKCSYERWNTKPSTQPKEKVTEPLHTQKLKDTVHL